ncbi:MAG: hypothetical protein RML95_10720 [Anaerolineae bacterium]|nr:hypothetical protein [Anaerolineae bacterium]
MSRNPDELFTISMVDRAGKPCHIEFRPAPDFLSDALTLQPAENSKAGAFFSALSSLIDGVQLRRSVTRVVKLPHAQCAQNGYRVERWRVTYEDVVTNAAYSFELPCRKSSLQPPRGRKDVNLDEPPFDAFKRAAEQCILSPDGNPIRIVAIRLIGRNYG